MNAIKRIERLEAAINGTNAIPEKERFQVVVGRMKNDEFVPNDGLTDEDREAELLKRYGTIENITWIKVIDRFLS
ncbi:MAG: hypothetical protein GX625_00835 [Clostridiaceae bacterium]|nr:hypothetical protein [Clostridiaceae bacterium]